MCKYCKRISCENCILKWLENHIYCGICKHQVTTQDMISLPFLDDMSAFFINNIDNQEKKQKLYNQNSEKSKNINKGNQNKINYLPNQLFNKDNNINNEINENNEINKIEEDKDICIEHGYKIDYYCIQCNKYFCSQCLIFFGKEVEKHRNHFIEKVERINDLGVTEAINEYKKLPETKNKIEKLIGSCNMKIKDNEIKKYEILKLIDFIKTSYNNKIEENSKKIDEQVGFTKKYKNEILLFSNKLNNIFNQGNPNYIQSPNIIQQLKNMNNCDPNLEKDILEKSKYNPKLFVENYQSEYLTLNLRKNQFLDNEEICNYTLNFIPDNPFKLIIKYLRNKININIIANINEPLNSPSFPIFLPYIVFKIQNYGLEFINLSEKEISQNLIGQINKIELDLEKFLFLLDDENIIALKICVTKIFYK